MKYFLFILTILFLSSIFISCDGPMGPAGSSDKSVLVNASIKPKVISTYPPNGGIGPFNIWNTYDQYSSPHFIIVFNKLIDMKTINSSSIRISGFGSSTTISVSSNGNSSFSDLLYFRVYSAQSYSYKSFRAERTYTVTIDTTVKDINGNHLKSSYIFSFTPYPTFEILGVDPDSTQLQVGTTQPIEIYFNSPVDSSILNDIQISPVLSYYPSFSSDSSYIMLSQNGNLSTNQTYTITIFAGAHDKYHSVLNKTYRSTFHTQKFMFTYSNPNNNYNGVSTTNTMYFYFTSTVLLTSIASSITSTPPINGHFGVYDKIVSYYIDSPLIEDSAYTIRILPTLKSGAGNTLDTTITINFRTSAFQVYTNSPSYGEKNVSRYRGIQITCNSNIDTSTVRSAFSMTPTTQGLFQMSNNSNTFYFQPTNPMIADSTYNVSISTQLKSAHGKPLKYSRSFNFTTGH